MARKCFIRSKNGEWEEIDGYSVGQIEDLCYGDSAEQLRARLAQLFGIIGQFEIEVREYAGDEPYVVVKTITGDTAILPASA